jgi:hypothetical protein
VFLRSCDWTDDERQCDTQSADQASRDDPSDGRRRHLALCIGVHYRLAVWPAFACWQALQVHVGPQLQASPHWHDVAGRPAGLWQPQVHSEPPQTAH